MCRTGKARGYRRLTALGSVQGISWLYTYGTLCGTSSLSLVSIYVELTKTRRNRQHMYRRNAARSAISCLVQCQNPALEVGVLAVRRVVRSRSRLLTWDTLGHRRHLRLLAVFSLGLVLCAVSIARVVQGLKQERVQENRILYGAIETVVASVVATTPTLYILLRPQSPRQSPNVPRSRHTLSLPVSSYGVPRKSICSSRMSRSRPRSLGPAVGTWNELSLKRQNGVGAGEGDSGTSRDIRVQLEIDQASGHIDDVAGDTGDIGQQVRVNDSSV